MFKKYLLPWIVWILYRSLMATWRIRWVLHDDFKKLAEDKNPFIFAHWHGDELALLPTIRQYPMSTMTSTSKDGQIMDFVLKKLGMITSRGSSTRGAVSALKGLVRLMKKKGRNASMAVDGPKGPIYFPKPGVFELARLTKSQIVPFAAACSNAKVFERSWNKTYLPKPFSKIVIVMGKPWASLNRNDDPKSAEIAQKLKADIDAAKQQAMDLITAI